MDDIEKVKARLAMTASGLNTPHDTASELDEADDDVLDEIQAARDSSKRALHLLEDVEE